MTTLSCAYHPARRAPYADILDDKHFYHVSPAYAKRFQKHDETEEQYVERLRQELEDKFLELGPETVIGCTKSNLLDVHVIIDYFNNQSSQRQWLGLPLVSFPHQRVISRVFILWFYFINLMHTIIAMKSVCDKFGALFILDEVGFATFSPPNFLLTRYVCQVMCGMGRAYQILGVF